MSRDMGSRLFTLAQNGVTGQMSSIHLTLLRLETRKTWWVVQDSNLWPHARQACALPAELTTHLRGGERIRTAESGICSPLPFHLATPPGKNNYRDFVRCRQSEL